MEIHSSSLALAPAKTKNSELQKNKNIKHDSAKIDDLVTPDIKQKTSKVTDYHKISNEIDKQQNVLKQSNPSQAINAYIQENTQLLKNQRTELISGIDFFA